MIVGIVLAAGEAKRLGRAKQLLDWHGEPLVCRVVEQAVKSNFDLVRVIVGAYGSEVKADLFAQQWIKNQAKVEIIDNPQYSAGQSTSVKSGLANIPESVTGAAFILADQPLITVDTYNTLIEIFQQRKPGILIPSYRGERGNPVIFQRKFFALLTEVTGDRGGREIIRQNSTEVYEANLDDPGILFDIDVYEDYLRLLKMSDSLRIKGKGEH